MNEVLRKLAESATNASEFAKSLADSGLGYVRGTVENWNLVRSLSVMSPTNLEREENHYVLVPVPGPDYVVYSKQVIPAGIGAVHSLPRVNIFHLPDSAGRKVLENGLLERRIGLAPGRAESEFADRLETLARVIDDESLKLSGGLLLIGGALAFVNPLAGAAIAAKGLIPSVATKASVVGAEFVGGKLRERNRSMAESKARREAKREVRRLRPEPFANPVLRSLDALVFNPEGGDGFDPVEVGQASCRAPELRKLAPQEKRLRLDQDREPAPNRIGSGPVFGEERALGKVGSALTQGLGRYGPELLPGDGTSQQVENVVGQACFHDPSTAERKDRSRATRR